MEGIDMTNLETIFWPQNKFKQSIYLRQKYPVKIETDQIYTYFSRNEDKQGFVKYFLEIPLLYYVLTDIVCNQITWRKSQGIVVITQEDELMPEFIFMNEVWKFILKEYCVYLDEQKKYIYGKRDVLQKMVALFEAYRNVHANRFSKRFRILIYRRKQKCQFSSNTKMMLFRDFLSLMKVKFTMLKALNKNNIFVQLVHIIFSNTTWFI